jgi:hypothetical protein
VAHALRQTAATSGYARARHGSRRAIRRDSAKLDETEREFEHECAALKVREAQVEAQELALEQARETCKTPVDAAQLKIMQAKLDVAKLDLKNEHKAAMEAEQNIRSARENQQKAREALQKAAERQRFTQVTKFVVAVAVGLFILAKCAGAAEQPSTPIIEAPLDAARR